ncbi:hypothetical protein [Methylobacterium sp. 77]|uniref:hypothetical protein n=1 Tax=Methylobacterium sp. 77 TaxID=1101192 RepID=UPI0012DF240E|nr:hypothetical protein [Methylobacterium sp. 77]
MNLSDPVKWTDVGLLVTAIFAFFAAVGAAYLVYGQIIEAKRLLKLNNDQLLADKMAVSEDHERSRRELSINLCLVWANFLDQRMRSVASLFETFSDHMCYDVKEEREIAVASRYYYLLSSVFTGHLELKAIPNAIPDAAGAADDIKLSVRAFSV